MTDEPKPETDMKEEEKKIRDRVEKPVKDELKEKTMEEFKKKQFGKKPEEIEKGEKKKEPEKKVQKKVKKDFAVVNAFNLPISTKDAVAVCRFINRKKIQDAIKDLENVVLKKKAVPMKGEIPHRKGKIMSGRFPKKGAEHFINLLKTLAANANYNEMDEPVISEAIANIARRPYGRFGRMRKKRTHVKIKAKEKKWKKKK